MIWYSLADITFLMEKILRRELFGTLNLFPYVEFSERVPPHWSMSADSECYIFLGWGSIECCLQPYGPKFGVFPNWAKISLSYPDIVKKLV